MIVATKSIETTWSNFKSSARIKKIADPSHRMAIMPAVYGYLMNNKKSLNMV